MKAMIYVLLSVALSLFLILIATVSQNEIPTASPKPLISADFLREKAVRLFVPGYIPVPDPQGVKTVIAHMNIDDPSDPMPYVALPSLSTIEKLQVLYPKIADFYYDHKKFEEGYANVYTTLSLKEIEKYNKTNERIQFISYIGAGSNKNRIEVIQDLTTAIDDPRNPVPEKSIITMENLKMYSFSLSPGTIKELASHEQVYAILPFEDTDDLQPGAIFRTHILH